MHPLVADAFKAQAVHSNGEIVVQLTGNADLRVREALALWLVGLHGEAVANTASRVVVDVVELEFMNSSCFKGFVAWLMDITDMPSDQQYKVHFRSNPQTLWQRRSLHALRSLALMVVTIES